MGPLRVNLGCGLNPAPGWLNLDRRRGPGVDVCCDLRGRLPLRDESVDYAVAIHVLQDLAWMDIPGALRELFRVLRPQAVLRLALPDLDRAISAYRRGNAAYFYVPDAHVRNLGSKLVTQIVWYGSVRTPFTYDFAEELLAAAGFTSIVRCDFRRTRSTLPDIVALDDRERESLFVEAVR